MKRDSRKTKTRAAKQEWPERMATAPLSPPAIAEREAELRRMFFCAQLRQLNRTKNLNEI